MASSSVDRSCEFQNPSTRRPLSDPNRVVERDAKLWEREQLASSSSRDQKMSCPCMQCKGNFKKLRRHCRSDLVRNGRYPPCRVWDGRGQDSSDEEWRRDYVRQCNPNAVDREDIDILPNGQGSDIEGASPEYPLDNHDETIQQLLRETLARATEEPDEFVNDEDTFSFDDLFEANDVQADGIVAEETDVDDSAIREGCQPVRALEEAMIPLYPGSRIDVLSFTLMFLNICHNNGFSNTGVNAMLSLLCEHGMPVEHSLPKNLYTAKKLLQGLGLQYQKIPVCGKGCMLFRKTTAELNNCIYCGEPKMKLVGKSMQYVKVLRYFPIIPRLKRLFATRGTSALMTWHHENRSTDGLVRHPADSKAWKHVDRSIDPSFAAEPRNVRLGLALDGVNPFGNNSSVWSTWPIMLVNYNIPPWLATKKFFMMVALIISGPDSVSEAELDICMAPVIEEFTELWKGVPCFDVLPRPLMSQQFDLRAMLLWTINDYPAYGLISGQQHSGYRGCVCCGPHCVAQHSKSLGKLKYSAHRRWLPRRHLFRRGEAAKYFDGRVESRGPPQRLSSSDRLAMAKEVAEYIEQSGCTLQDEECPTKSHGVKRKCALYDLPYWNQLLINHCLDAMHCEKNLAHNIVQTILGAKETHSVREDMKDMGLREYLWLKPRQGRNTTTVEMSMPPAPYCFSKTEKSKFLEVLLMLKSPTGFSSSLAKCVSAKKKLSGLKSHDYHQLMQQILPLATMGLLNEGPRLAIFQVSNIWRKICAKVWDPSEAEDLLKDVAFTLCILEMHFPPSFFDVMTHLMIHVVEEVILCGPVHIRWMYPIERYLKFLKGLVRNMARPEASMAEGYLLDESIGFLAEYIIDRQNTGKRSWESEEDPGVAGIVFEGAAREISSNWNDVMAMHHYVLENEEVVKPWYRYEDPTPWCC